MTKKRMSKRFDARLRRKRRANVLRTAGSHRRWQELALFRSSPWVASQFYAYAVKVYVYGAALLGSW